MTRPKDRLGPLKIPLILTGVIWTVFLIDYGLFQNSLFGRWGVVPRSRDGLVGILAMPFIHYGFPHILGNTLPLFVFTTIACALGRGWGTIAMISVLGGALLWVFGRPSIHGGASGLIYGLAVYLIVRGIVEKRAVPILVSIGIAVVYGGMLLSGVLPTQQGVSWDGHLLGGVGGLLVAVEGRKSKRPGGEQRR